MKKYMIILTALVGITSCSTALSPDEMLVELNVGIKSSIISKASTIAGTSGENLISSIQVFVFKHNLGAYMLEASAKANYSSVKVNVTSGQKDVLVLVNEPADYTSETDRNVILSHVSNLSDNSPSDMVMIGQASCNVSTSEHFLEVAVNRMASRIRLCKVTNSLANGYADKNVKLSRVFLTSAAASTPYLAGSASSGFYATAGIASALDLDGSSVTSTAVKSSVNSLIYKNVSSDVIPDGGSFSTPIPLYGYPNDGTTVKTHLVVEMEIDGKYFTYPIEMPSMARNCTCEVTELVITSIGNPSNGDDVIDPGENDPITFTQASFNVTVQPWTIVPVSNNSEGRYII